MTSYRFFSANLLPVSGFVTSTHLRSSKSIRRPDFGEITQSMADILLVPVFENQRPAY